MMPEQQASPGMEASCGLSEAREADIAPYTGRSGMQYKRLLTFDLKRKLEPRGQENQVPGFFCTTSLLSFASAPENACQNSSPAGSSWCCLHRLDQLWFQRFEALKRRS